MRTWHRVLRLATLAVVLAVAAVALPQASVAPTDVALVKTTRAAAVDAGRGDVIWIAAIGSDARDGQDMLRARGDALQMIALNTRTGAASAIGIPRDSWVAIPGHGSEKINAALYFGGPEAMAGAMANLVGVRPDYVFVTRFPFFEDMVADIGGIEVVNPRPFSDPYLKDDGFKRGRIHLGGYDAMAFSRIRKGLAGGDFDRSANQQRVLRGIQRKVAARADEPGFLERGVLTVLAHTQTSLPPGELFRLANAVAQVDHRQVRTCVLRGRIGNVGAASVVFADVAQARRLGNDARRDGRISRC